MKKYLVISFSIAITLLLTNPSLAQQKKDSIYPLILNFYSIGTGTPGMEPLQKFISTYRKQNKLPVLKATQIGGLGREGEFAILFPLKELKVAQRKKFLAALSKALPTLKTKEEMGGIHLTQNEPFDESRARQQPEMVTF